MAGVQTENTSDAGGTLNVGWIDANDWMAYNNINIPTKGQYRIEYRVASSAGGQLSLDLNGGTTQLGTVSIPATGGWQTWTTVSQSVTLNAGNFNFGIFARTGGWNINWFKITLLSPAASAAEDLILGENSIENKNIQFDIYPNPASSELNIRISDELSEGDVVVYDNMGREVLSVSSDAKLLDISMLPAGIYSIQMFHKNSKVAKRFIKQ